mmetsp:Transcript_21587/g.45397  ORF Transcript_21587/g.45397 Transcript_21587/m.45397 type:complete len:128 (+) Transcript_21587:330-713(+)
MALAVAAKIRSASKGKRSRENPMDGLAAVIFLSADQVLSLSSIRAKKGLGGAETAGGGSTVLPADAIYAWAVTIRDTGFAAFLAFGEETAKYLQFIGPDIGAVVHLECRPLKVNEGGGLNPAASTDR